MDRPLSKITIDGILYSELSVIFVSQTFPKEQTRRTYPFPSLRPVSESTDPRVFSSGFTCAHSPALPLLCNEQENIK